MEMEPAVQLQHILYPCPVADVRIQLELARALRAQCCSAGNSDCVLSWDICVLWSSINTSVSDLDSRSNPQLFYTRFCNHTRRLRLETLLYLELSRSPNGIFKPLLDPSGRFASETAARWFQK
jgi:hypothetical protein